MALCSELRGLHTTRSCSALWTSWGEMWVEAVKKCLSTWVPFCSFSNCKNKFKKKKSVQAIKACWLGSCLSLYPWPDLSGMPLGKAGSPLSVLSHTHLEAVLLQRTEESSLVLLFQFVCPAQTCEKGKGAGKDRISVASALWWSTVNSFLTYLNFAQKSTLHYSLACLGHVNSSIRKIYFNSERK